MLGLTIGFNGVFCTQWLNLKNWKKSFLKIKICNRQPLVDDPAS